MLEPNSGMAMRWYIVQAYSNFERKVAEDIRQKVAQKKLDHLFEDVIVPTEKVVEMRRGRKVDAERKFFPGYVLVKMDRSEEHTSELQSRFGISYAVFCLKKN